MGPTGLSFKNPPLKEVSFSLQFQAVPGFHTGLVGVAWSFFRRFYPIVEERDELGHELEVFGVMNNNRAPQFKLMNRPACPRLLCLTENKAFAIQIQKDRFAFNWIHQEGEEYPRFEKLKALFEEEVSRFLTFAKENNLGEIKIDQLELTYVNWIPKEERYLCDIIHDIPGEERHPSNIEFEQLAFNLTHVIKDESGKKIGRLYTNLNYPNEYKGESKNILLRYTARVHPKRENAIEVLSDFTLLRNTINSSFEAMTKSDMHTEWKREQ
ncbi:TIGR04255 family protein [Marinobacter sp. bablab_jr008]|uniref:TIGR04255 family protein n=1 Tax=Marinobacter sp. bablab_jr008 TaxID=2755064 RepID=UPI0018F23EC7|nr:TIGR04255 family protein [Marinobacter sp. bablab_jr008]MEC9386972.1 TIGR04255 family protein [Pseudomonadota bacterium]